MDTGLLVTTGVFSLLALVIIFLIIRRIRIKKNEDFENREN